MQITNKHDISLPLAVWLLHDDYDYVNEENYISATSLLKSTKQIILGKRVPINTREIDISDFLASRMGHAMHDSIEKAWRMSGQSAMLKLGYPENVVDKLKINPDADYLKANPDCIPIYIERRSIREINGFKIGGKFDVVIQGRLFDHKTTSVYSYLLGNKDEDYSLQGSIYRWLNEDIITSDKIYIQFIFTDWQKFQTKTNPDYPKVKTQEHIVDLKSITETEEFIVNKINDIVKYYNEPEENIPPCNDKELWRSEPKYKYYSDPLKTDGKSTRNFDTLKEANDFAAEKGKGIVKTIPGEVKACDYCPAFNVCKQKDNYYV